MIEIPLQLRKCPSCGLSYHPYGDEAQEQAKAHKENQIVVGRLRGTEKARSIEQLDLFMAGCQLVADNTDDPQWSTKAQVKLQCKAEARLFDPAKIIVTPSGQTIIPYRSLAFRNLKHLEACRFFDIGFEVLACKYFQKVPRKREAMELMVDEFIRIVKSKMKGRIR